MRELKSRLRRGDMRELARRLDVPYPKVFHGLEGFIKGQEFRAELKAAVEQLLEERAAAEAAA